MTKFARHRHRHRHRHRLRPALLALAALAGVLLAPGESSACESMKAGKACPPSMASCCCNPAPAAVESIPAIAPASASIAEACPSPGTCSCESRPESPTAPASRPARVADEDRSDRGESPAVALVEFRPSPRPAGSQPPTEGGPPHVPLYLRNLRFLI